MSNLTLFKNFFFSFGVAGLVTTFTIRHLETISNIFYDFLTKYPGVGTLTSQGKSVKVKTDIGDIYLPLFKLNSLDIDIYFFMDQQVQEHLVLKDYVFNELFGDTKCFNLKRYGTHIIKNITKPSDLKGDKQISGFIRSYLEDKILVFTIKNDEVIDYKQLINEFIESNYDTDDDSELENVNEIKKTLSNSQH